MSKVVEREVQGSENSNTIKKKQNKQTTKGRKPEHSGEPPKKEKKTKRKPSLGIRMIVNQTKRKRMER